MSSIVKRNIEMIKYLFSQDDTILNNLSHVIKLAFRRPIMIVKAIFIKNSGSDFARGSGSMNIKNGTLVSEVSQATNITEETLSSFLEEFESDLVFHQSLLEMLKLTTERPHDLPNYGWRKFLYLIVRGTRPNIMIETGSFDGLSTAVILLAMNKNNMGTLFTIDLPNPRLPSDINAEPAWIVPDYLRDRFHLIEGSSAEKLKLVIEDVGGNIDMFYHDSWHSYKNMLFEYETAWNAIRSGGFLMSENRGEDEDIDAYHAIIDFIRNKKVQPAFVANNSQFIIRK